VLDLLGSALDPEAANSPKEEQSPAIDESAKDEQLAVEEQGAPIEINVPVETQDAAPLVGEVVETVVEEHASAPVDVTAKQDTPAAVAVAKTPPVVAPVDPETIVEEHEAAPAPPTEQKLVETMSPVEEEKEQPPVAEDVEEPSINNLVAQQETAALLETSVETDPKVEAVVELEAPKEAAAPPEAAPAVEVAVEAETQAQKEEAKPADVKEVEQPLVVEEKAEAELAEVDGQVVPAEVAPVAEILAEAVPAAAQIEEPPIEEEAAPPPSPMQEKPEPSVQEVDPFVSEEKAEPPPVETQAAPAVEAVPVAAPVADESAKVEDGEWEDQEDLIEMTFKTLVFKDVDQTAFKAELRDNLGKLGVSEPVRSSMQIRLRAGSVIAELMGSADALMELRAAPIKELRVCGASAEVTRGAEPLPKKRKKEGQQEAPAETSSPATAAASPKAKVASEALLGKALSGAKRKPRFAVIHVKKEVQDGCEVWMVVLDKDGDDTARFGFSHASGKTKFAKSRGDLGDPDVGPEVLVVKKLSGTGLLDGWNEAHPEASVRPNDRISAVGGSIDIDSMVKTLREPRVEIKITRFPEHFEVTLTKREDMKKYGFKFEKPTNESQQELRITNLGDGGLMEDSNKQYLAKGMFHMVVMPGMCVTAANDKVDDANAIADELRNSVLPGVTLQIRRCEITADVKSKLRHGLSLISMFGKTSSSLSVAGSPDGAGPTTGE